MKFLKAFDKIAKLLSYIICAIAVAGLIVIILVTVTDVVLRCLFNFTLVGSYEISQYLLLISVFASFAYCQATRSHITVTMFTSKMPRTLALSIDAVTGILSSAIWVLVGIAIAQQAQYYLTTGFVSDLLRMPVHIFLWISSISMFVFALVTFCNALCSAAAVFSPAARQEFTG